MRRTRERDLRTALLTAFRREAPKKSFHAWVVDQATAGDSEADEYLGLVNQRGDI